jgi:hypothetical protein
MKTVDQKFCQHRVDIGAIEELEQILSEGRPPFPPVVTSKNVVEVFDRTLTRWTFTGVSCRVEMVDLYPDWKPFAQKYDQEDLASVVKGTDSRFTVNVVLVFEFTFIFLSN